MQKPNQIRIIGGCWRGRKIQFPANTTIRPTADRTRETLFNWLQNDIVESHCLDCFAGSGALGLEALSRGAAHVDFIDSDNHVCQHLIKTLDILQCAKAKVHPSKFEDVSLSKSYDIIFLDPPFSKNLIFPTYKKLHEFNHLKTNTLIYVESETEITFDNAKCLKAKKAGQVWFYLFRRFPPPPSM